MKSALAFAAGLALAPAAHAQVACSEIDRVSKSAAGDFKDLKGPETEDDLFRAKFSLAGARECTLEYSFDITYACLWTYPTEEAATVAYNTQVVAVGGCLPAWERRDDNDSGNFSDGLRFVRGLYFAGLDDQSDLEWGVAMEERKTAKEADWRLRISLVRLK